MPAIFYDFIEKPAYMLGEKYFTNRQNMTHDVAFDNIVFNFTDDGPRMNSRPLVKKKTNVKTFEQLDGNGTIK